MPRQTGPLPDDPLQGRMVFVDAPPDPVLRRAIGEFGGETSSSSLMQHDQVGMEHVDAALRTWLAQRAEQPATPTVRLWRGIAPYLGPEVLGHLRFTSWTDSREEATIWAQQGGKVVEQDVAARDVLAVLDHPSSGTREFVVYTEGAPTTYEGKQFFTEAELRAIGEASLANDLTLDLEPPETTTEAVRLAVLDVFDRQERTVLARLGGTKARRDTRHWDPPGTKQLDARYVLDQSRWVEQVQAAAVEPLRRAVDRGMVAVSQFLHTPEPDLTEAEWSSLLDPLVQRCSDAIAAHFERVVSRIDELERTGAPLQEIQREVSALYRDKEFWAQEAAASAALAAYNAGGLEAAKRDGRDIEKTWSAMRDGRTRDSHAHADGQTVPVGEPFRVGESLMMHPGSTEAPIEEWANCRCVMTLHRPSGVAR